MMGGDGLKAATESAILAANYVARRLSAHYPVLYSGPGGLVAHECILDLRPLKDSSDVGVEDVAKRLIDYGFHPPTVYFPLIVDEGMLIEPTAARLVASSRGRKAAAKKGTRKAGAKKGDRVGIMLPNCPQFVIAFYGALRIGDGEIGSG